MWQGKLDDRDGYAFVGKVLRDAARRFSLDLNRVVVTGHSRGATFVWYFACANSDHRLKAFAPTGGTPFIGWENECAGKTPNYHLIHTHGKEDKVVNYGGTPKKPDWYARYGAKEAIEDFAGKLRCKASNTKSTGRFEVTKWADCIGAFSPALATFEGGHEIPSAWVTAVIEWFEDLPL